MTDTDTYSQAFQVALDDLAALQAERDKLQEKMDVVDARLDRTRQGALGLAALVDIDFEQLKVKFPRLFTDYHDPKIGITEAVKGALRNAERALSPIEVRDRVLRIAPAVGGHKSPMASIHAVLRRLDDSGDAVTVVYEETGRTVYGWTGDNMDRQAIKRRLADWCSNPEEIMNKYESQWKGRPEGEAIESASVNDSDKSSARGVRRKSKPRVKK